MPTKGIVVATLSEAKPLIEGLQLKAQNDRPFQVYKNNHYTLILSGVGMLNATMATTYLMQHHAPILHLYNVGIAGSAQAHQIGSLWLIHKITHSATSKSLYPDILYTHLLQETTLHCVDIPATKDMTQQPSPHKINLVDMESFGVCFVAMRFAKAHQVSVLKVVSDHLLPHNSDGSDRLDKAMVTGLIDDQAQMILDFIKQYHFDQKPLLPPDHQKALEGFLQTIKLSATQRNALKRYCLYRYLQNHSDFDKSTLEDYLQAWQKLPKA